MILRLPPKGTPVLHHLKQSVPTRSSVISYVIPWVVGGSGGEEVLEGVVGGGGAREEGEGGGCQNMGRGVGRGEGGWGRKGGLS